MVHLRARQRIVPDALTVCDSTCSLKSTYVHIMSYWYQNNTRVQFHVPCVWNATSVKWPSVCITTPRVWNASYSTHVKCYSTCVTWNFTRGVHIYTLWETWSTQTRDVNSTSLCHVSLRVHACSFEVIIERYCNFVYRLYHQYTDVLDSLYLNYISSKLCTLYFL